jgi:hypothetical protein
MVEHPVAVEDYREALRRLLIGWNMHTAKGIEIAVEHRGVITLVYPWVAQVHRFGDAFLGLEKRGHSHEAHVIVRSALEHAMMAHWVAVTGDAGVASRYAEDDRLLEQLLKEAKGRPRDVTTNTWDMDLLQQLVDTNKPVGANDEKVVQKINQICQRLGVLNTIYPAYRVHSWFAHPTTHSTSVYLVMLDDGSVALRDKPIDPAPGATLSMLAHCVYWARRVLDDLTVGRPYEEWLDEIGSSIQVMQRLPEPQP